MKKLFLPFLIVLVALTNAAAQEKFEIHNRPSAITANNEPLSTGFSGTGAI